MAPERAPDSLTGPASAERCCLPGLCAFSPLAVGVYRLLRRLCREADEDPIAAACSLVHAGEHTAILTGPGRESSRPSDTAWQRWADRILDVERAERAGCTTDEQVSAFLCPFGPESC